MSKITFRADDDLIDALDAFDASKSEVMRQALRQYLDEQPQADVSTESGVNAPESEVNADVSEDTLDSLVAERVDELVAQRLRAYDGRRRAQDVNVNVTLDGDSVTTDEESGERRKTGDERRTSASDEGRKTCGQCGENVSDDHVYCPNCGEKTSRRVFCDCGDELRSDWGFCPSCGRRTPAADVLDSSETR